MSQTPEKTADVVDSVGSQGISPSARARILKNAMSGGRRKRRSEVGSDLWSAQSVAGSDSSPIQYRPTIRERFQDHPEYEFFYDRQNALLHSVGRQWRDLDTREKALSMMARLDEIGNEIQAELNKDEAKRKKAARDKEEQKIASARAEASATQPSDAVKKTEAGTFILSFRDRRPPEVEEP